MIDKHDTKTIDFLNNKPRAMTPTERKRAQRLRGTGLVYKKIPVSVGMIDQLKLMKEKAGKDKGKSITWDEFFSLKLDLKTEKSSNDET